MFEGYGPAAFRDGILRDGQSHRTVERHPHVFSKNGATLANKFGGWMFERKSRSPGQGESDRRQVDGPGLEVGADDVKDTATVGKSSLLRSAQRIGGSLEKARFRRIRLKSAWSQECRRRGQQHAGGMNSCWKRWKNTTTSRTFTQFEFDEAQVPAGS